MCSEERCATKELHEVPGGSLVDGLPPKYPEKLCFDPEHYYACKELYEVPVGDQVAAVPPLDLSGDLARWRPPRAASCRAWRL
eukprot:6174540-Pyramimonas_sp.AAC.1